jgi:rRNA maturation RNase YbeY
VARAAASSPPLTAEFVKIKEYVLGKRYDLSLAFLPPTKMREAMKYKKMPLKKDALASNVLSFPLSPASGEILICKSTARSQAKDYGMDYPTFLTYLFIHGLLHIKGLQHGATMESEERRIMRRFGLRVDEQSSHRN